MLGEGCSVDFADGLSRVPRLLEREVVRQFIEPLVDERFPRLVQIDTCEELGSLAGYVLQAGIDNPADPVVTLLLVL